ncbi:MAG: hypothetical protein IKO20_00555 [Bacteroidaceae bacterium]|nr:hypothetical protein [Bacteroidaceae bacterium]
MKTTKLFAVITLLISTLMPATAQVDIEKAIYQLTTHRKVDVTYSSSYDRAPSQATQSNSPMKPILEIYSFSMKNKQQKLIDNIVQAFLAQRSNPACYRIESYGASTNQDPRQWNIVYGEDEANKIEIGRNKMYNYTFVNIADQRPEAQGQYRTCYCIEWRKGAYKTDGRIIITYARIPTVAPSAPAQPLEHDPFEAFEGMFAGVDTATIKAPIVIPGGNILNLPRQLLVESDPLTIINTLLTELVEADDEDQSLIAPLLYRVVKDAVQRDLLTADEQDIVRQQILRRCTHAPINGSYAQTTQDYLRLAAKVLEPQNPR